MRDMARKLGNLKLVENYGHWIEERTEDEWTAYFISVTFKPLSGTTAQRKEEMIRNIEQVYSLFVTRSDRRPMSRHRLYRLPLWIATPDRPVAKHQRMSLRRVRPNDGLHYHITALVPPWTRLKEDLTDHFERLRDLYVPKSSAIMELDVEPITFDPGYVVGYGMKSVAKWIFESDDIVILPQTVSERTDNLTSNNPAYQR